MLSAKAIDQAARHSLAARTSRTPGRSIPESHRPADADSAIAIHARVLELLGEAVGGWKCGVPNPVSEPIVAALPKSAIVYSGHCVVPGAHGRIEPEIAFVMARDLPPRGTPYSESEVIEAIGEARMVLELLASRYANPKAATPFEVLADACNHHGLLIGPALPSVFDPSWARLHVTIHTPTNTLFDEVRGHPSGHPLKALLWLVEFLNGRGQGLKAGEIVTTGSYAGAVEVPLQVPIHVHLGGLASMDAELLTE